MIIENSSLKEKIKIYQSPVCGADKVDKNFEQFQIKSLEKCVSELKESEKSLENQLCNAKKTLVDCLGQLPPSARPLVGKHPR